ncbi:hypothetical protein PHISP_00869 [Aspergillus sp. HF37]|nr:hypothetical protein PHISP_00869 [Aspergillus sp. HF37]
MAVPLSTGIAFAAKTHNDTYPAIAAADSKQNGRAVFISGASKGIGRATAISFAQAGASDIAIAARSALDAVEEAVLDAAKTAGHRSPRVLKLALDVTDEESVRSAASQTEQIFGRLDIVVNNAGCLEISALLADIDQTTWLNTWEINLKGTYLMTRAFLPLLLKGGEKTIVNVSSIGAHLLLPGMSAYQSSKLATLRLTEFTSLEYAGQGILAFAINPGSVATELGYNLPAEYHSILVDTPELPADTIVWLTQEKRAWLAGRYLSANWDMPEVMSREEEIVKDDKLKVRMVL